MHAFSRREWQLIRFLSSPLSPPHLRSPFRVAEVKEESSDCEGGKNEGAAKQHDGNCRSRTDGGSSDGPHRFISGHAD